MQRVYLDQDGVPILLSPAAVRRLAFELDGIPEAKEDADSMELAIPNFFTVDMTVSPESDRVDQTFHKDDQHENSFDAIAGSWPMKICREE